MKLNFNSLVFIFLALCVTQKNVLAVDGLRISELPLGSEVVIPGDYFVLASKNQETILSGMQYPQAVVLTPSTSKESVVQVFSKTEKRTREYRLKTGTSAVYNLKNNQPVRFKCLSGDVKFKSLYPIKVQR
jgi:hypothetical protein